MRNTYCIAFFILSLSLFAQRSGNYVGVTVSPAVTKFVHQTGVPGLSEFYSEYNPFIGGSIGFSGLLKINNRFVLQSELLYSIYSERNKREVSFIDPDLGFVLNPESDGYIVIIDEYQCFSLPLLVNMYLNNQTNRWTWFIAAGVRGNLFTARYFTVKSNLESINDDRRRVGSNEQQTRLFTVSGQVGFGLDYNRSRNFRMRVAPFYEQFINSTYKSSSSVAQKPYALGLQFGAYWSL